MQDEQLHSLVHLRGKFQLGDCRIVLRLRKVQLEVAIEMMMMMMMMLCCCCSSCYQNSVSMRHEIMVAVDVESGHQRYFHYDNDVC